MMMMMVMISVRLGVSKSNGVMKTFVSFLTFVLESTYKGLYVRVIAYYGSIVANDESFPNLKAVKFGHRLPSSCMISV
jgi:hypothetical protein